MSHLNKLTFFSLRESELNTFQRMKVKSHFSRNSSFRIGKISAMPSNSLITFSKGLSSILAKDI